MGGGGGGNAAGVGELPYRVGEEEQEVVETVLVVPLKAGAGAGAGGLFQAVLRVMGAQEVRVVQVQTELTEAFLRAAAGAQTMVAMWPVGAVSGRVERFACSSYLHNGYDS
jgi:ribosomal protein S5